MLQSTSEVGEDLKELEDLRNETNESLEAAQNAKSSEDDLVRTCSEHGIIVPKSKSLDSNIRGNENLLNEIIEKMGNAEDIATKLGTL